MSGHYKFKKDIVKNIQQEIENSSSLFVATYHHLSVSDLYKLRSTAKEEGVKLKVLKNRLVKIAAKNAGYDKLADFLVGPNIFAFGGQNDLAPAKMLAKFAKDHKKMKLITGIYEGNVINHKEVNLVASLPSYKEALTMFASSLQGGLKQISIGLKMVGDQKPLNE